MKQERLPITWDPRCNLCAENSSYVFSVYAHQPFLGMNGAPWPNC